MRSSMDDLYGRMAGSTRFANAKISRADLEEELGVEHDNAATSYKLASHSTPTKTAKSLTRGSVGGAGALAALSPVERALSMVGAGPISQGSSVRKEAKKVLPAVSGGAGLGSGHGGGGRDVASGALELSASLS